MDEQFLTDLMQMPEEVTRAILECHGREVAALEEKLRAAVLDGAVDTAIAAAGGRSGKAIRALLDMDELRQAADPHAAARDAVAQVKKTGGYLFATIPGFAPGTGGRSDPEPEKMTLAEALKERFTR